MIVTWWLLLILFYYRNPNPFRIIKSGEKIVDEFEHCVNNSYYAPFKHYIKSSGILLMITNRKTYKIKPGVQYLISLIYTNKQNKCNITLHNNGNEAVIIKQYYIYPPIWKRILYIIAKYGNTERDETYW